MKDFNQLLRPQTWDDVVGQEDIKEICRKSIAENKFPKFSIFYGPTGVGKSCMAELIAKELTGYSGTIEGAACIQKYNMAALAGKNELIGILEDIFKLKSIADTTVYILEEVQVLRQKEEQAPFLEELTKIPDNIYIMMCTTKISSLLPEIKNRAILFQLSLPTEDQCETFVDNILEKLHYMPLDRKSKLDLITASRLTPRSIIKHIELLASNQQISSEDIAKFFKTISNTVLIEVLHALTNGCSLYIFTKRIRELLKECHNINLVYKLRDFTLQLLVERAADIKEIPMSKSERAKVNELLGNIDEGMFLKIFEAFSKLDSYTMETEQDLLAAFIKLKLLFDDKTHSQIIVGNRQLASAAFVANKQSARQLCASTPASTGITEVNLSADLSAYGIGDTLYEES